MSKEDFRQLLAQWAKEDVYINQLTWEEGDALVERLSNWYASKQKEIIELKQYVLDLDREAQTGEFQNAKVQG